MERISPPVLAGILTALVGFTSSSAVVLTGLRAVGATPSGAASGLLALCATQGLGVLWLVRRHRIPLTLAWSTPGAALLASTRITITGMLFRTLDTTPPTSHIRHNSPTTFR